MPINLAPAAFTTPEKTMVEKFEEVQRNLINRTDITARDQVAVRRILLQSQRTLAALQRTHLHSRILPNFYQNAQTYVRLAQDIEATILQNVQMLNPQNQTPPASIAELFQGLSQNNALQFVWNSELFSTQMERARTISTDIVRVIETLDGTSGNHDTFKRFDAIQQIVCKAINEINDVLEGPQAQEMPAPENDANRTQLETASASESETDSENQSEEEFDDFGLYAEFRGMEKQLDAAVLSYEAAWNKIMDLSKAICRLLHKEPDLSSSDSDDSSSSSASNTAHRFFAQPRDRHPSQENANRVYGPGM